MSVFVSKALALGAYLAVLAALAASGPLPAQAQSRFQDYFKGKTIRLVVGTPPGGGYDAYGRLVARHLSEHLGNPTVIVSTWRARPA